MTLAAWTSDELDRIADSEELELAPARADGSLRKPVTVWVVRDGDDLYVRSAYGPGSRWYKGVQERHEGRVSAGGVEKDVRFAEPDGDVNDAVDDAYRTKYRRYDASVRCRSDGEAGRACNDSQARAALEGLPWFPWAGRVRRACEPIHRSRRDSTGTAPGANVPSRHP